MAPEAGGGDHRVQTLVRQAMALQPADGVGDLSRGHSVLFEAEGAQLVVEPRHLLDHAHDAGLVPIALEVAADRLVDPLVGRRRRRRIEDDAVERLAETFVHRRRHLTEHLFLRFEVVVERAVRQPGALRDVGDAGVEEAVFSNTSLAAATRRARVSTPLRDRGPLGFSEVSGVVTAPFSLPTGSPADGAVTVPSPSGPVGGRRGRASPESRVPPLQEEHARRRAAARGDDGRRGIGTWRSPASWRSWSTASWMNPKPCVRPSESCPPCGLTGSSPSSAMRRPPSSQS